MVLQQLHHVFVHNVGHQRVLVDLNGNIGRSIELAETMHMRFTQLHVPPGDFILNAVKILGRNVMLKHEIYDLALHIDHVDKVLESFKILID